MNKILGFFGLMVASFGLNAQSLDWYHLDNEQDSVRGMSTYKAYELLKDKKSTTVIVGVLDSGVDINHEDLKDVIWVNKGEVAGNGKDDDGNGFVDDINGWDFLGAANGEDIEHEQLEVTRLYKEYNEFFDVKKARKKKRLIKKNKEKYKQLSVYKGIIDDKLKEADQNVKMYSGIYDTYLSSNELLKETLGVDELTEELVAGISDDDASRKVKQAKAFYLRMMGFGAKVSDVKGGVDHFESQKKYNYNVDYNPRAIIGDNQSELTYGEYGNNEVVGADAQHGTHVAGIIGANRTNDIGIKGVADNVKILVVRCVPDGDERDKDVANAIRYAVDNGAKVINMSFGKAYSPNKNWVDDAVKYAESKDVLLVAAAGNDSQDVDVDKQYPTRVMDSGNTVSNWISVGALDFKPAPEIAASFSNYGTPGVDVFAPGVAIYSTVPGSKYENLQGTSMASPAVAGVAALIRSYFPELTAAQVKQVLLDSAVKITEKSLLPGAKDKVDFNKLCVTGGRVNAYEAVKLAEKMTK